MADSMRMFVPSPSNPWDYAKAAHLLNRAGFGGKPEEIQRLIKAGPEAAVDEILNYERVPESVPSPDFSALRDLYEEALQRRRDGADEAARRALARLIRRTAREKFQEVREWWVRRMLMTQRPLQEKMVLFWHGLLVSGVPEVRNPEFLFIQNGLFRRMALGNYKDLILAISRDPAMLNYLDNNRNRKGKPNENYARELLELFTMGLGNFTEPDVKEAARAFTGWTNRGTEFIFNRAQHDDGAKIFLGRTGNFDGTDVIDIIFRHPATARFLPRKLFEFFVYLRPEDRVVEELGTVFKKHTFEVRPLVRTLLLSEVFYSPKALRAQVKSPVQLVIGTARTLDLPADTVRPLVLAMDQMGQALLAPPNVGGWPRGERWITTSTVLDRYNFAGLLTSGRMPGLPRRLLREVRPIHLDGLVAYGGAAAGDVVERLVRRMLPAVALDQKRMFALLRVIGANRAGDRVEITAERARTLVHLIMSMPEYQLH